MGFAAGWAPLAGAPWTCFGVPSLCVFVGVSYNWWHLNHTVGIEPKWQFDAYLWDLRAVVHPTQGGCSDVSGSKFVRIYGVFAACREKHAAREAVFMRIYGARARFGLFFPPLPRMVGSRFRISTRASRRRAAPPRLARLASSSSASSPSCCAPATLCHPHGAWT